MMADSPKTLVAYYSRSGNTRRVAEELVAALDAAQEVIRDVRSRLGFAGWWRSGREAWRERPGEIEAIEADAADFDLVVIGTPIWAGRMSSPVRSYLLAQGSRCRRVALFCTAGGTAGPRAFAQMAELCGQAPVATLSVSERELKSGTYRDRLADFVAACRT